MSRTTEGSKRILCAPCAQDTAVKGRCPALQTSHPVGAICSRCLSDKRMVVTYNVCCEPTERWRHTAECQKERKRDVDPALRRLAVSFFSTDPRVLTLAATVIGSADCLWEKGTGNAVLLPEEREMQALGKVWDLGGDGKEPEATYRKEAEYRAFAMRKFDRKLTAYVIETRALSRKSAAAAELPKTLPEYKSSHYGGRILSHAEHQANLLAFRKVEERHLPKINAERLEKEAVEAEKKRQEKALLKEEHCECGDRFPIINGHIRLYQRQRERCTLSANHPHSDHQFFVKGKLISRWTQEGAIRHSYMAMSGVLSESLNASELRELAIENHSAFTPDEVYNLITSIR